jgi:hypothetical protein
MGYGGQPSPWIEAKIGGAPRSIRRNAANNLGLSLRPGYRVIGVPDHLQPEKLWICIRRGDRRGVTEEECENCPYWEQESPAKSTYN